MKALMIATEKLPVPPIRGGAIQTYIANVAPRLAQSGIDLTILGRNDPELPNEEIRDGVRYVRVEGGMLDRYQESVTAFLATERFDRIHLFNRPRLVLPVATVAPDSRLSLSLHNEMFLPNKIDPTEARAAIAAVDRIATVSNFIGKGISDPYPEAGPKLRTIYSGVDAGQFVPGWSANGKAMRDRLRQEHGLTGRQVVLFVGRLSPKKGADILLRAMEIVAQSVPGAALVLVGSKWYGADEMTDYVAYLQNLAARSAVPVVATGFITPDQVNQWFAAGDLFVCPSVWQEPLARVHYEAMAAGLPLITTRRGGNPEVVEGTGIGQVVDDPESPEAMAQAILGLLKSSSKRAAMGQAGRQLALERFTWDRVASEIGALWAEADQEAMSPVTQPTGEAGAAAGSTGTEQGAGSKPQESTEQESSARQRSNSEQKPSSGKKQSSGQKSRSEQKSGFDSGQRSGS
ncbi:MAG TPA: glycosyltransferase family 4 protein, partial [Symbiobacteriaceae bacterium]|nr:glycosyltransferase family 4 protein [Symbiobacteriaceae bacterium]